METISSFKINHEKLFAGLYVSRKDIYNGVCVTTFDIRLAAPNHDAPLDSGAIHTIEHIGATFFRNSELKDRIVYFGPMGCKTGFYLVMFGDLVPLQVDHLIKSAFSYIADFSGEIPGATAQECGNFALQCLELAKAYAKDYLDELTLNKRYVYKE